MRTFERWTFPTVRRPRPRQASATRTWTGKKTAAAKNWDTVRSKFLLGRKSFLGRMSTGRITIDVSKDAAKVAAANEKAWKVLPAGDYEEDA